MRGEGVEPVACGLVPDEAARDPGGLDDRAALGGGIEWAFAPRWSLKAEYLHVDFGDLINWSFPNGALPIDVDITADIARVGVNYSFGQDFWGNVLGAR